MLSDIQQKFFEMQKDPYLLNVLKPLSQENIKDIVSPLNQGQGQDPMTTW
jgi:hypothetical protein